MFRRTELNLFSVAVVLVISLATAHAQTQRGQIVGRVTDSTGAVVPGAKVEVTNPATGVKLQTETNAEGLYTVPYLQYGTYRLAVTAQGFAPYTVTGVEIATATTTAVNVTLALATVSAEVTVQAGAIVLESTTTSVGTVIDERLKSDVPNIVSGSKRSAASYVDLSPGVNGGSIAGSRDNVAESMLDGQSISARSRFFDYRPATPPTNNLPSVEAIGEYKMILNSMPAEYGHSSGGLTIFATKSGTNQYHGAAYEYLRNQVLDARAWQAAKRDVKKQNEFGFAGGGPVLLPKIYDGHDKTFFWANITGYILRTDAASQVLTVPTQAMRNGDFSAPDINPIYNPTDLYTNASGKTLRRQFSYGGQLNVIDPKQLSPVSKYFLDKIPLPNLPGSFLNYVGSSRTVNDNWDFSVKGDHYLSSNSRISGFYQWSHPTTTNGSVLGGFFGNNNYERYNRVRLDWSYNIRPNLINQVLYGFTRYRYVTQSNNFGENVGRAAGLQGTYDPNCPEVIIGSLSICSASQANHPADQKANLMTTFNDTLMWNRGAHTFKTGLQIIRYNENFNTRGGTGSGTSSSGSYSFASGATANTDGTGGSDLASFFLGYPSTVNMQAPTIVGLRQAYIALFVQDDWKVLRRLTINAGLRWDLNVPYSEVNGQITDVDLNRTNPAAGNLPGALRFYGSGAGRVGTNRPGAIHWKNFGPRLGLAYQIDDKTVFRAFGGIIYQGAQNADAEFADHTGFIGGGAPKANPNPFGLYYSWDTPYPQDVLGTIPNTDPSFRNDQSYTFSNPSTVGIAPALYQWSGGFQREIKGNVVLEATYLATNMKHSMDKMALGVLDPKYRSLGPLLNRPFNSPEVQALGFTAPYPGFNQTLPLYRALDPYPQYNGLTDNASTWTAATYNAVIFRAQKRFSAGLTFLVHYTISKNIASWSSAPGQYGSTPRDPYNLGLNKALARADQPQRVVVNYSYELPFGPGKKFGANTGRVGSAVLGDWTLSGFQQYQSGIPVAVSGALGTAIPTVDSRADRVLGVPVRSGLACSELQFGNPAKNYIWNAGRSTQAGPNRPLAYQSEGDYGFGNMPTVEPQARQCALLGEALTITKALRLRENLRLRFGVVGYNIFNRHTWRSSSDSITSASFGIISPYQGGAAQGGGQGLSGARQMQLSLRIEF